MKEANKITREAENSMIDYIKMNTSIGKRGRDGDNSYILHYYEYLDKVKLYIGHEIFYSEEMKERVNDLSKNEKNALNEIERCLKEGIGIAPYLSKDARLGKIDNLFNDWNILHCHLGNRRSEKKYLKGLNRRTGNIVMLMLIGNKAYFLDVFKHNMWGKKSLLEIVYRNWKYLLNVYNGELDIQGTITENDINNARNAGYVYFVDIEPYKGYRVIVLPNGLGMVSSQHPSRIVRKSDLIYDEIRDGLKRVFIEKGIANKYDFTYRYPNLYIYLNYEQVIRVLCVNIMALTLEEGEIKKA